MAMVNIEPKRNSMTSVFRLCFTIFLQTQVTFSAETRTFDYQKVTVPNIGLSKPKDTFKGTSLLTCSSHCSSLSYCRGFVWDSSGGTCTTGSWPRANGDMIPSGSKTYFTQLSKCRFDLGYELRPYGAIEKCVFFSRNNGTFQEAKDKCNQLGGRMCKTNTLSLIQWFQPVLVEKDLGSHLWVGLDDILSENNFIWSDGQGLTAAERAQIFSSREPNNDGGAENCVLVDFAFKEGLLNDAPCSISKPYACEMDI